MDKVSVSIPGGNGRMGKTLIRLILESENHSIGNATCLPEEDEVGLDIGNLVGKSKISKELSSNPTCLLKTQMFLLILLYLKQQCITQISVTKKIFQLL